MLKEFEDLPHAQGRKKCQNKVVQFRCRSRASVCGVQYLLHALRSMKDEEGASTGATAAGVLKKVDHIKFLAVLQNLKFMLPYSLTLSKKFQSGALNFPRLKPVIEKTTC